MDVNGCRMASARWPLPGYIDENNYLCLSGRYKEIINRGGEKISPFEATKCAGSNWAARVTGNFAYYPILCSICG